MRLLIAIPVYDKIPYEFMQSLTKLVMHLKDEKIRFDVEIIGGTLIYVARDKLAGKAINEGYTHMLWLDSDMVFTPDLVEDLMFSGKDFVTGVYHSRHTPYVSCIFKSISLDSLERYDTDYPKDTFEVAGCGFGCVFINVDILRAVNINYGTCFLPMKSFGEDLAFCKRATDLGYHIYCEPGAILGHVGHVTIYPEDREIYCKRYEGC